MQLNKGLYKTFFQSRIGYALFIVLFTLLSFETLLRVFKRNQTWSEKVGHGYVSGYNWVRDSHLFTWPADTSFEVNQGEFKYRYKTNHLGIREREVPFSDSCSGRIICLGDSYTEGLGTAYDSSYPKVLEKQLLRDKVDGFEVYNAGVAGSDPFYSYMLLKQKLLTTSPNFVLITFNSSDLTDYVFRGGMERFHADGKTYYNKGPWFETIYRYSYLIRFFCEKFMKYDLNLFVSTDNMSVKYSEAVAAYANLFDSLNVSGKAEGRQTMVIIQPIAQEVVESNAHNKQVLRAFDHMEEQLTKRNIPFVNMLPYMRGTLNQQNYLNYFYPNDAHYNSAGYQLLGEKVYEAIQKRYPLFFSERK